eukprot:6213448-Pleurochrysis_carterae.AAC.2
MDKKFGKSLAVDLLHALRCYDAYMTWRGTCDLATPDAAARERVALLSTAGGADGRVQFGGRHKWQYQDVSRHRVHHPALHSKARQCPPPPSNHACK